jgi:hypothetical protein
MFSIAIDSERRKFVFLEKGKIIQDVRDVSNNIWEVTLLVSHIYDYVTVCQIKVISQHADLGCTVVSACRCKSSHF